MAAWIGIIGTLIIACVTLVVPFIEHWLGEQNPSKEIEYVGRVIDGYNQQPISGARVSLALEGVPPIVYTDNQGIYVFKIAIKSKISGQVRVDAQGYQIYIQNISISPNIQTIEDIRLTPQGPAVFASPTGPISHATNTLATIPTETPTPAALPTEITDVRGVKMVLVPAGEFTMGSNYGPSDEQPVHRVYLDNFYFDKYEVANFLYKACVDAGICQPPQYLDSQSHKSYYNDPQYSNYPVIYVSWYMAITYCEWRNSRLPTEAEWEKAARGDSNNIFPWGNSFDATRANFCDKHCVAPWSGNNNYDDGYAENAPVDAFPNGVSVYGIYNMAGNVWEWVSSLPYPYPYNAGDGRENMNLLGDRVLRGGSWNNEIYRIRSSLRFQGGPSGVAYNFGFRCARSQ
jgi:formylglycine-generating enzyme required for sulfatase activity